METTANIIANEVIKLHNSQKLPFPLDKNLEEITGRDIIEFFIQLEKCPLGTEFLEIKRFFDNLA